MINGIGTDIIEIERIKKAVSNENFLKKYFTQNEIDFIEKLNNKKFESYAGNFAAKEAVSKAFSLGFSKFFPIGIEVLRDENGKPYVVLHGEALRIFNENGYTSVLVSISHSKENAIAFAIIV